MSSTKYVVKSAIIQDPYTGKRYDFGPLFHFLDDEASGPDHVSSLVSDTNDVMISLFDKDNVGQALDVQRSYLNNARLRDVFHGIVEIE